MLILDDRDLFMGTTRTTYWGTVSVYTLCSFGLLFKTRDQFVQLLQRTVAPLMAANVMLVTLSHSNDGDNFEHDVLLVLVLDIFFCHAYEVGAIKLP